MASHLAVVICDTRAERSLGATGYGERRAQCEAGVAFLRQVDPAVRALRDVTPELLAAHEAELPEIVARRCRFIIEEEQRVQDLAAALPGGDGPTLAALLDASWRGANELYEIGASAMTEMHRAMDGAPGLIGRRQAGAGFGGCLVALVERDVVAPFAAHVGAAYEAATGIGPRIFAVEAADGAGRLWQPDQAKIEVGT
jgi:galactokinase